MSEISAFQRIVADVVGDIKSGRLRPGDVVPSVPEQQAKYGVSYGTVRQARLYLKAKMYIERGGRRLTITTVAPYL
jgi:DNA-binding GntR family transcriptional regulator